MKNFIKITAIILLGLFIASCKKEETLHVTEAPVGLGGDKTVSNETDKWIYENLTKVYNVAGYYKWKPGQFPFEYEQIPPSEDKALPVFQAILHVCIEPYNAETGSKTFMQKYLPKTLILAGSNQYLSNGLIVLGTAEGGTAITFFDANSFKRSKSDTLFLKQMVKTLHHEFAHILHQNIIYPQSFRDITGNYTGSWFNITNAEAIKKGFVTNYAQSGPDDDFVETYAVMLSEGKAGFEKNILGKTDGPDSYAYQRIKMKEAAVVEYFLRVWKIDVYSLQIKTRAAYESYLQ